MTRDPDQLIDAFAGELAGRPGLPSFEEISDAEFLAREAKKIDLGKWDADPDIRPLIAALLVRRAFQTSEPGETFKAINCAAKAIDQSHHPELGEFAGRLTALARDVRVQERTAEPEQSAARRTGTLPITVLFSEGPIARAYLATLAADGLRPARIINMVSTKNLATGAPVGRLVPAPFRRGYRGWAQRQQIHHWPKTIAGKHPQLLAQCTKAVGALGFDEDTQADARALRPLNAYCDDIVEIEVERLKDQALSDLLQSLSPSVVLFTGGGLVPRSLLSIGDTRFLHIHPGKLPDLRGADCTLWSSLIGHRPSASAFWMAPGIDTGRVIASHWLPRLEIGAVDGVDPKTLYRTVYAYVDPWLRAALLRNVMQRFDDLSAVNGEEQDLNAGKTYHFMHPSLHPLAFERLGFTLPRDG